MGGSCSKVEPEDDNPVMAAIEEELREERKAREDAERRQAEAQQSADDAARRAAAAQQEAENAREAASKSQRMAEEAEARARQEKVDTDVARAAQHEAERKAEASRLAQAEATERARRASEAAKEEKEAKEKAEQDAARITQELEDAKQKWRDGIQPVVWPTEEEYNNTLKARQYKKGFFHFAVAGTAGCGKSSLINAFRGVVNGSKTAAAAGVTETTLDIGRYPDPRKDYPFVWYDIPGAGTLQIPRWEYFNKQGLFIFDCIIVLWDNRFTDTDIAILDNCSRFKIPCFIVRSKSDNHIKSLADDMEALIEADDSIDEDEKERRLELIPSQALTKYCEESQKSVETNLQKAELPAQKVYLVSNQALRKVIQGLKPRAGRQAVIDEVRLIQDILTTCDERRHFVSRGEASDPSEAGNSLLGEGVHRLFNGMNARWKGGSGIGRNGQQAI